MKSDDFPVPTVSHAPLSEYTTFRLGGICRAIFFCQTPQELVTVVTRLIREKLPFILIGGESNLVVADEGVDCFVVRYLSRQPIISREGNDLIVSGSTALDDLAQFAAQEGLEGFNYATGIPGTMGGAVVGNAGAFGKQVGDVLKSATLLNAGTGISLEAGGEDMGFLYRDSKLKKSGDIVVAARFRLTPGHRENLLKERDEILHIRREKHPDLSREPCAGSFFRNIEPTSRAGKRQATGWFLEQAGGKSLKCGGAVIYQKHANIIIKSEGCTAENVYELSRLMAQMVKDVFNLDLVREVRFVGRFKNMPDGVKDFIW